MQGPRDLIPIGAARDRANFPVQNVYFLGISLPFSLLDSQLYYLQLQPVFPDLSSLLEQSWVLF